MRCAITSFLLLGIITSAAAKEDRAADMLDKPSVFPYRQTKCTIYFYIPPRGDFGKQAGKLAKSD